MSADAPGRSGSRVVGGVTLAHFFSHFYILIYPPLFPFFVDEFGLGNAELGLVMSVGTLGPLFLQILVGRLVDDVGGKWPLVAGLAVTASGTALVATAASYPALLAFAGVAGLGQAAFHPADYTLLEAATTPETRGRTFSVHTFGGYAGFAAAPLVAGLLGEQFGWQFALAVCGAAGLAYALVLAVGLQPISRAASTTEADGPDDADASGDEAGDSQDGWRALVTPSLLALFGYYLLTTVGVKGIQTFGPRFLSTWYDLSTTLSNVALTLFFAGTAGGILLGGRLADAYAEARTIVASLAVVVAGVGLLSAGVPIGRAGVVGVLSVVGLAVGVTLPSRDSLVSTVSAADAGSSFGFVFTGLSLGAVVSPAVLGRLADATNLATAIFAIACCYLVAAGVVASLSRLHGRSGGVDSATSDG